MNCDVGNTGAVCAPAAQPQRPACDQQTCLSQRGGADLNHHMLNLGSVGQS